MYIIQLILNIVFFIINSIFTVFGFKTKQIENHYRKNINNFLNTPKQMLNNTNDTINNNETINNNDTINNANSK